MTSRPARPRSAARSWRLSSFLTALALSASAQASADSVAVDSASGSASDSAAVAVAGPPAVDADPASSGAAPRRVRWLFIPALFSLPETGLGAAIKARGRDFLGVPGYLDATVVMTRKRQIDLDVEWLRDSIEQVWRARNGVQIGRFPSVWYGPGNPPPDAAKADYDPLYVYLESRLARYLPGGWAVEGSLVLDVEDVSVHDEGAFLGHVVARDGGVFLVGGVALEHEGRDLPEDPRRGPYLRVRAQSSVPGSESVWQSLQNDASQAASLGPLTGVARVRTVDAWGDVPFWELPYLGFREALRGLPDRRLRGRSVQCAGLELRWRMPKLLVAPWQIAGFLELGRAGSRGGVWSADPMPAGGGGLRGLLDGGRSVLRADYGVSPEGTGIYLDFGQAF